MAHQEVVPLSEFRDLKKKLESKVILVVEDDETMQSALKRILESDHHRVLVAADGTELSVCLESEVPDLILLDVGLPWLNGFELATLLKEHPDLKRIPLLFVSGQTDEADIKRAFAVGADDYIKKPFDVAYLRKAVQTFLHRKT